MTDTSPNGSEKGECVCVAQRMVSARWGGRVCVCARVLVCALRELKVYDAVVQLLKVCVVCVFVRVGRASVHVCLCVSMSCARVLTHLIALVYSCYSDVARERSGRHRHRMEHICTELQPSRCDLSHT